MAPSATTSGGRIRASSCCEPPAAGADLAGVGLLVDAALAAPLELEMLDRIGDVGAPRGRRRPRPARGRRAGRPGRRTGVPARSSWSPGCSPTKTMRRVERAFAEHGLGRAFVEIAAGAAHRLGADRPPSPLSGQCRRPRIAGRRFAPAAPSSRAGGRAGRPCRRARSAARGASPAGRRARRSVRGRDGGRPAGELEEGAREPKRPAGAGGAGDGAPNKSSFARARSARPPPRARRRPKPAPAPLAPALEIVLPRRGTRSGSAAVQARASPKAVSSARIRASAMTGS